MQILPHGKESSDAAARRGDVTELSEREFGELIADIIKDKDTWGTGHRYGKWSLPGAQPKVALHQAPSGRWATPNDSTPTTHILKPSVPPYSSHHINEFMTMCAARHLGFNVAMDAMVTTDRGDQVLVSKRYDRVLRNQQWVRLHQEDLCQAMGVSPDKKYQSEGGPSVRQIAALLRALPNADDRDENAYRFFEALVFNVAMLGTDAHAKNYSLMLDGRRATLAPLYDLGSHAPYPAKAGEPLKLAMSVDDEYRISAVGVTQLVKAGVTLGLDEGRAHHRATEILEATPAAYLAAADDARQILGEDAFIDEMTDSVAHHAKAAGQRT